MRNRFLIRNFNFFRPLYLPSKSVISLPDVIPFLKSDCHLKIAYMVFNMGYSLLFHCGIVGTGVDNSECLQLFPLESHRGNEDGYAMNPNRLFFKKEDICDIIDKDDWILFCRDGGKNTLNNNIKKTIYTLSSYSNMRQDINFKHRFSFHTCLASDEYFVLIDDKYNNINDINSDNIYVNYLNEYTPSLSNYVDYFNAAKIYAKNNPWSNEDELIKVIAAIKEKFKLSDVEIAHIVYEKEMNHRTKDALAKRVTRRVEKGKMKH